MKKYLFAALLLIIYNTVFSQAENPIYGKKVIVKTRDSSSAELQIINSTRNVLGFLRNTGNGNTIFKVPSVSEILGLQDSLSARWTKNQSDDRYLQNSYQPTFQNNVTLNGPVGIRVGKYTNGQTIPAAGKTLDQFLADIAIEAVAPTYNQPSVSISSSPSGGNYERGTNLGTITLSRTFTQNDAGAVGSSTYSKYVSSWNNLGSNTDAISSLTGEVYYRVTTSYNQGACKNNNLGQQDCTGRIEAGSVTSGNIAFIPFDKRYWGFASTQSPNNSTILALSQDNSGSNGSLTLTNISPSGSQFIVYFTKGTVSQITVNGIPATSAFTITTYTVTNAQGYASTYTYVYSNNAQTSTINSIQFQ